MNPILPVKHFVPDVEARQWQDGRVYLYGSYDIWSNTQYCSHIYHVFSSEDLISWQDHGISFNSWGDKSDVPWNNGILYAPDCIYFNNRYHMFFCQADNSEGIATSTSPFGPFGETKKLEGLNGDSIDPAVFIDDDNQGYIYWGQFQCRAAKLKNDLSGIDTNTIHKDIITEAEHGFHEGASIRKRADTYYLLYTDISRGKATCIAYATCKSPFGPFKKGGIIIDNLGCDNGTWNNHGSMEEINGKWYIFYHRSSANSMFNRRVCVEPIEFNEDKSIDEVEMTTQGVEPPVSAMIYMEAYRACLISGKVKTEQIFSGEDRCEEYLANIHCGDYAVYKYINFDEGVREFNVSIASLTNCSGEIEVKIDNIDGNTITNCKVTATNGWTNWKTFQSKVIEVQGVHAVYLMFKGDNQRLYNIEGFCFK